MNVGELARQPIVVMTPQELIEWGAAESTIVRGAVDRFGGGGRRATAVRERAGERGAFSGAREAG